MKTYPKEKLNHCRGGNWNVRALKDLPYDGKLTLKQIVKHMVCFTTFLQRTPRRARTACSKFYKLQRVQSPFVATHMREYRHCIEDAYLFYLWCDFLFPWRDFLSLARLFSFGAPFFPLARLLSLVRLIFRLARFFFPLARLFFFGAFLSF